jgi:hypothetical protein
LTLFSQMPWRRLTLPWYWRIIFFLPATYQRCTPRFVRLAIFCTCNPHALISLGGLVLYIRTPFTRTFVYRMKINKLIFKNIYLLYSFVYSYSTFLPNFVLKFGLLPKLCRM